MREILFRGKNEDTGEWVYGFYTEVSPTLNSDSVIETPENDFRVLKDTVGQYTGLEDENGNKIFEGDVLRAREVLGGEIWYVAYKASSFCAVQSWSKYSCPISSLAEDSDIEIIGNIHDNPTLIL